ncbi:MAG: helix-turn-helix transcriptional regulator [Rhodospirillales bacterium]|nr:helix-turn-helix transcriptional regulator [Rhodospirillales bacterium]
MTKLKKRPDNLAPRYNKMPAGVPSLIDLHVGRRLRQRRTLQGMSQEHLGESVGVTFQQVQKYERGANRLGARRLYQFSIILNVSVSYFFEDMPSGPQTDGIADPIGMADQPQAVFETDNMARRETLELIKAYYQIADPTVRKRILELARSLGDGTKT